MFAPLTGAVGRHRQALVAMMIDDLISLTAEPIGTSADEKIHQVFQNFAGFILTPRNVGIDGCGMLREK